MAMDIFGQAIVVASAATAARVAAEGSGEEDIAADARVEPLHQLACLDGGDRSRWQ
jgi:hypothetical protein